MNQQALNSLSARADFRAIARWVEPRATVLDLGCGDGSLLSLLMEELDVTGYGIELNDAGVLASTKNGINVIQQNLEDGLRLFEDHSFDIAILSQTLQTFTRRPQSCARPRASGANASCRSRTSATGRIGCRCCAAGCRCRNRCLTNGTTRRTCGC